MATIEQQLNQLTAQKNALVTTLNSKGINAYNAETFNTLIPKVNELSNAEWHVVTHTFEPKTIDIILRGDYALQPTGPGPATNSLALQIVPNGIEGTTRPTRITGTLTIGSSISANNGGFDELLYDKTYVLTELMLPITYTMALGPLSTPCSEDYNFSSVSLTLVGNTTNIGSGIPDSDALDLELTVNTMVITDTCCNFIDSVVTATIQLDKVEQLFIT